jgi:alpha-mannosidase
MLIPKAEARIEQSLRFLEARKYRKLCDLDFEGFETEEVFRSPPGEAEWRKIGLPFAYGREWSSWWFRTSFALPPEARGEEVFLRALPRADSLVFIDGQPAGAVNPRHEKIRIAASGEEGRRYTVHLESYAGHRYPGEHPLEGESVFLTLSTRIPDYPNIFEAGQLVVKEKAVYGLYYDASVLFDLAKTLDRDSLRRNRILRGLYEALSLVRVAAGDEGLPERAAAAARGLEGLLGARNGDTVPEILLIGHAHIDHAWLWPIFETERKVARTFANMARYAEEFPEFVFIQSQPAQLEIVEREYPAVFAKVKEAYARGQWEPNGGMWVEADCNLPGGESLVRQFLVGKAASRRMLGYEGDTLWLPDVFGYAAALPQILAGCGIEYFVTSKINWNDTTRFPYDTFVWRGIDGTGVKTHFITSRDNGYNGKVSPESLADAWRNVQHKDVQDAAIKSIGEGDGGGGTLRSDLEAARRLGDLEGAPKACWSRVSAALARIFADPSSLPAWKGELYLELHRGTYTTQARTKRFNRALEGALAECELLYAALSAAGGGASYPRAELLDCWKILLTNQFHDIIPGSSIRRVYEDAEASYRELEARVGALSEGARGALAARGSRTGGPVAAGAYGAAEDAAGLPAGAPTGAALALFNALSWERADLAALPAGFPAGLSGAAAAELVGPDGAAYPIQSGRDLDGSIRAYASPRLPSMGYASFAPRAATPPATPFSYEGDAIETPFYSIRLDESRRIARLFDKEGGSDFVGGGGALNSFQSADDLPVLWDAWDIDSDWKAGIVEEDRLVSSELVASGPLFLQLRNRYRIGERSELEQDMVFYAADRRIDFRTRVEWRESHKLLKAAFPTSIATDQVRCEVQYGHLLRATHENLPEDRARFEFCAHKWVCLEEPGRGLALLNDCKYGHDASGSLVRLTLLRSPKAPDAEADMGSHEFSYSLLPFSGSFADSRVLRSAYELNRPATALEAGMASASFSFLEVDDPRVIVEAVKLAEDSTKTVVRLYEAAGAPRRTRLRTACRLRGAWECDMLERQPRELARIDRALELEFRPFEIKTLLLDLEGR